VNSKIIIRCKLPVYLIATALLIVNNSNRSILEFLEKELIQKMKSMNNFKELDRISLPIFIFNI
jgi:hypothetical protein